MLWEPGPTARALRYDHGILDWAPTVGPKLGFPIWPIHSPSLRLLMLSQGVWLRFGVFLSDVSVFIVVATNIHHGSYHEGAETPTGPQLFHTCGQSFLGVDPGSPIPLN